MPYSTSAFDRQLEEINNNHGRHRARTSPRSFDGEPSIGDLDQLLPVEGERRDDRSVDAPPACTSSDWPGSVLSHTSARQASCARPILEPVSTTLIERLSRTASGS
jgi:hypothetical protein